MISCKSFVSKENEYMECVALGNSIATLFTNVVVYHFSGCSPARGEDDFFVFLRVFFSVFVV